MVLVKVLSPAVATRVTPVAEWVTSTVGLAEGDGVGEGLVSGGGHQGDTGGGVGDIHGGLGGAHLGSELSGDTDGR